MFGVEENLKDVIIECLGNDGKSISGLSRELTKKGHKYHRLTVTGYVKALADLGYLKERKIPPSKVYYAAQPRKKDFYEALGEKIKSLDMRGSVQAQLALYILQELFHRPIFLTELDRCGFMKVIRGNVVKKEVRNETKKTLKHASIQIPKNDPAYTLNINDINSDHEMFDKEYHQILSELFVEQFGIKKLISEGKQVRLDGI